MKKVEISFIVAVYNIEKHIERCIDSLINQNIQDIEIILVDDCSTDNSGILCKTYSEQYPKKIKYIKKHVNEGLSEARNTGLMSATGEYVMFVDGDDYIESDAISHLLNEIGNGDVDAVIFGNQYNLENGKIIYRLFNDGRLVYKGDDVLRELFPRVIGTLPKEKSDYDIGFAPWARLIRRQLLINENIFFTSERKIIYEDLIFTLDLFPNLKNVRLLNLPLYHYCENEQSLTKTCSVTKFDRIGEMYFYIINNTKYRQLFENNETKIRFKRTMLSYIRLCLIQTDYRDKEQLRKIIFSNMTKFVLDSYPIHKLPIKQRILFWLLNKKYVNLVAIVLKIYKGVKA